jgi:hypothetical protein
MRSLGDGEGRAGFLDAVKTKAGDGLRSAIKVFENSLGTFGKFAYY